MSVLLSCCLPCNSTFISPLVLSCTDSYDAPAENIGFCEIADLVSVQ